MKLVYCKMAAARLNDGTQYNDELMLPYRRNSLELELENLMDKVPEHFEIQFNFAPDVLAEKNPARFFLHRYLNSWVNDFYAGDLTYVDKRDERARNFFTDSNDYLYTFARKTSPKITSSLRFQCPDRNMSVDSFFMDPYIPKVAKITGTDGTFPISNVSIPETTRPREEWLNMYKRLNGADPEWVRAGGCYVIARAIKDELDSLRQTLEESGEIEHGEELRPMLLNSNKFTREVIHAVARLLQKDGLKVCEITPREFPTFEEYDAPVGVTDTAYITTRSKTLDAVMLAMGMPGVFAHNEECLAVAEKYRKTWYDGRWTLKGLLPEITLPTPEGTVASDAMRMQTAMDEIHFNEEYAINTLFPEWDSEFIYMNSEIDRDEMFAGNSVMRFPRTWKYPKLVQAERAKWDGDHPRPESSKKCGYRDHVRLYISDVNRDEWRYRICRMFYTITYESRHFADDQTDAVLSLRLAEFKEVLTQYRDHQMLVYTNTYGDLFTQYEADFAADPLQASAVIAEGASPQIQGLYRNIAMLNRMIDEVAA